MRYRNDRQNISSLPEEDFGPQPYTANLARQTVRNPFFRTARWTGEHLQLTLMSLLPGEDIGAETHPDTDQLLYVESGFGLVRLGEDTPFRQIGPGYVIIIPAGTFHNVINTGRSAMKLFSVYAPPNHPHGTVHRTRQEAAEAEHA